MKTKLMTLLLGYSAAALAAGPSTPAAPASPAPVPVSIDVTNRRPLTLEDVKALRTYARDNSYYFSVNLKEGMRVLYSASYGIGGEAAQARGTLVERDGRFVFKQSANPSSNLLQPPGLPFNGGTDVSLWDLGAYMDLVNRVAFSDPNNASKTSSDVYGKPEAALVDFAGGTAGETVEYSDALEVVYQKQVYGRSDSNLRVYYAKGIGPVALEFRENLQPSGTFKVYVGE